MPNQAQGPFPGLALASDHLLLCLQALPVLLPLVIVFGLCLASFASGFSMSLPAVEAQALLHQ